MNKLDVVAVLKGLGVDILLSLALSFAAGFITGYIYGLMGSPPDFPAAFISLILSLVIGLLCCFVGGYVTARGARQEPIFNVFALSVVIIILGSILAFIAQFPLWYNIASFALVVPFTYGGGYLFLKKGVRS
ncbi:MAG: hypothetical protein WBK55_02410 [Alphaproteobacteria bacterium]